MKKKQPKKHVNSKSTNPSALALVRGAAAKEPVKLRQKANAENTVEVSETSLLIAIDMKRNPQEVIDQVEFDMGQRFFPYSVLPRLLVGWQAVGFISSFELKLLVGQPLPEIIVRFVEKMTPEDISKIDEGLRQQILSQVNLVRQYPFVKVECPLLVEETKQTA
jgi:hypothetical protein